MRKVKDNIRGGFRLARFNNRMETGHFRASAWKFTQWVIFWLSVVLIAKIFFL